ncbi:MAG TPA: T9SS type A sorting domain-containing protein [Candidatus Kapabacteria bacterium]|nr:T9SS type A sorting domain-containing protein [Candidatus Kapabacteria bacterium]
MFKKVLSSSAAVGSAAGAIFSRREKGEQARFNLSKGIAIAVLFIALMLGGAPQMRGQTQDTSRLLWSRNFGYYSLSDAKFFADGEKIAVSFSSHNCIIILSAETGEILDTIYGIRNIQSPNLFSFAFHNNDNRFLYATYYALSAGYTGILKYDMVLHKIVDSLVLGNIGQAKVILHPTLDKMYFIGAHAGGNYPSFYHDSILVALNISPLSIIKVLEPDANFIHRNITITQDGKYLITVEEDQEPEGFPSYNRLVLRDAETLELSTTIPKNQYGRYGVIASTEERCLGEKIALSPDGKLLATCCDSKDSIYLWSTVDWKFIGGFYVPSSQYGNILFSCNSKYIFVTYAKSSDDKGVTVYSVKPPFERIFKFPNRDQNGELLGIIPLDISCDKKKMIINNYYTISLLTIPEFITSVEQGEGPKKQDLLYPNPTNGDVSIIFNEPLNEPTYVQIANEQGAIIYKTVLKAGSNEFRWNTSNLSQGIYLCTLRNKTIFSTYKIMVER